MLLLAALLLEAPVVPGALPGPKGRHPPARAHPLLPTPPRASPARPAALPLPRTPRVAKKFQQSPLLVDLVGEENTGKLADTITLLAIQVEERRKKAALVDLLSVYGAGGWRRAWLAGWLAGCCCCCCCWCWWWCMRGAHARARSEADDQPKPKMVLTAPTLPRAAMKPKEPEAPSWRGAPPPMPACPQSMRLHPSHLQPAPCPAPARHPHTALPAPPAPPAGGKAIVFTRTKAGADEVAAAVNKVQLCEALHGDIAQQQREHSLQRFRDGHFSVLAATDVASRCARGRTRLGIAWPGALRGGCRCVVAAPRGGCAVRWLRCVVAALCGGCAVWWLPWLASPHPHHTPTTPTRRPTPPPPPPHQHHRHHRRHHPQGPGHPQRRPGGALRHPAGGGELPAPQRPHRARRQAGHQHRHVQRAGEPLAGRAAQADQDQGRARHRLARPRGYHVGGCAGALWGCGLRAGAWSGAGALPGWGWISPAPASSSPPPPPNHPPPSPPPTAPPPPAASRSVLNRLDKVEPGVIDFFEPAAERLLAAGSPAKVLAAALAAMSGFRNVPAPKSLLTSEEGYMTLSLLGPK